jgi:dynein heavy chain/atypical dual specificity phosphatase
VKTVLTVAAGLNVSYPEGGMVHKVLWILIFRSIIYWT